MVTGASTVSVGIQSFADRRKALYRLVQLILCALLDLIVASRKRIGWLSNSEYLPIT